MPMRYAVLQQSSSREGKCHFDICCLSDVPDVPRRVPSRKTNWGGIAFPNLLPPLPPPAVLILNPEKKFALVFFEF